MKHKSPQSVRFYRRIALVNRRFQGDGPGHCLHSGAGRARVVLSSRKQVDCEKVAAEISLQKDQCIGIAST